LYLVLFVFGVFLFFAVHPPFLRNLVELLGPITFGLRLLFCLRVGPALTGIRLKAGRAV
jgi:hypothetical protein